MSAIYHLRTAQIKVICGEIYNKTPVVQFLIFLDNYKNTIGMCEVRVRPNRVAEIYRIHINEPYRRKHYGSQLWSFAEKYMVENYNIKRFIGELNLTQLASAKFWKSHNFRIQHKTNDLAFAIKDMEPQCFS